MKSELWVANGCRYYSLFTIHYSLILFALLFCPGAIRAQDTLQLGDSLQRMELALLRNIPATASCTIQMTLTRPGARGEFVDAARLRPIQLQWKGPADLALSFSPGPSAPPAPAQDDLSTWACRGPYFDARMQGFFKTLRGANRAINRSSVMKVVPLQIFFLTLRADATAKVMGRSAMAGHPVIGMDFPRVWITLPMLASANHVKVWVGEKDGLPVRLRGFTQRQGILTFDITYAAHKDASGIEYLLPDTVTLQPSVAEDLPSAAFPMRITFMNYKINVEIPDGAFE